MVETLAQQDISGSVALVTGSNRGVGRALVEALIQRGARKVYAAGRDPQQLRGVVELAPDRIVAVQLDVTRAEQIEAASRVADDVTLLVNNAGVGNFLPSLEAGRSNLLEHMNTNFLGTFDVIRAFVPVLRKANGAVIVNVMSLHSFGGSSGMDGYSASKAAMHSLTQSIRPVLARDAIGICGVYPGAIDTDMIRGSDALKASPQTVAHGLLDGVEGGEEDIFPDPVARLLGAIYQSDPKRYEKLFTYTDLLIAEIKRAQESGKLSMSS